MTERSEGTGSAVRLVTLPTQEAPMTERSEGIESAVRLVTLPTQEAPMTELCRRRGLHDLARRGNRLSGATADHHREPDIAAPVTLHHLKGNGRA